jgi:hypothetical protein
MKTHTITDEQWRDAASALCRSIDQIAWGTDWNWKPGALTVATHGSIQPVADGAFVECVIFVPREAVK